MRDGALVVPGVGFAAFPVRSSGRAEFRLGTEVRFAGTGVRVPGDPTGPTPGWHPIPRLTAPAASARLDSHDPFRGLDRSSPHRPPTQPGSAEVERWNEVWRGAWDVLAADDRAQATDLAATVTAVVPWLSSAESAFTSASSEDAFGAVMLARPTGPVRLAETLVHEFHHTKLSGLLNLVDLHHDADALFYTAWRDDPRPLGGVLHGVYAFAAVAEFWRRRARRDHAAWFEFAYWRKQTSDVAAVIRTRPELTPAGRSFVDGIADRTAAWSAEDVPAEVEAWAGEAVLDHRADWRLAHVEPPADLVKALADAWITGAERPEVPPYRRLVDTPRPLDGPLGFLYAVRARRGGRALTPAERAYVAGDLDTARRLAGETVANDPDTHRAWVVLGLVARRLGDRRPATALLHRPELVRAVTGRVRRMADRPVDVAELAAWLAPQGEPDFPPVHVVDREPA